MLRTKDRITMNTSSSLFSTIPSALAAPAWPPSAADAALIGQQHDWFTPPSASANTLSIQAARLNPEAESNPVDAWAAKLVGHLLQPG
jgi:hypothetical protein